jgi:ABC-type multidrug transport system fused ATPase/permease subunit
MLKDILKENYKLLIIAYLLFLVESILMITYPLVLGKTIDHFIEKNFISGIYLFLVLGGFMLSAYFRRKYDTRIFSTLYRKLILRYISREIDKESPNTSKITARTTMFNSIVSFFEIDIPYIFHAVFSIIGSIIIISISYNGYVGLITTIALIPMYFVSKYYSVKLSQKYKESNDLNEHDVDVIGSTDRQVIKHHYVKKNILSIKISDLDAGNNLSNDSINYSLIVVGLFVFTLIGEPTIGTIMGLYQYLLKFTANALMIPSLILRSLYLKDVLKRIEEDN